MCFLKTFHTSKIDKALAILAEGFRDVSFEAIAGVTGVLVADRPLDIQDGVEGTTVLSLNLPDEEFARYELVEDGQPTGQAIVLAEILARFGPPTLYDHEFIGLSRHELYQAIRRWEEHAPASANLHVENMKAAVRFFDRVGWRSFERTEDRTS